jgi:hypothetical protein
LIRILLITLLAFSLCTPLGAQEEEHEQPLGFLIGLGLGLLAPDVQDVLPAGISDAALLARLDLGVTVFRIIGVKAVFSFSPFDWRLSEEELVPMSHQIFTLDLFTEVDLGERWRLWPAAGYTLDASITDTRGTGFLIARGLHAELGCGYRLNSIMFVDLGVGYHFTGDFKAVDVDDVGEKGVELGDAPGASYLDVHAGIVFSLR